MTPRRSWIVYGMLFAIWVGLIFWQVAEHVRVAKAVRAGVTERARYVAATCSRIMRARGGFTGIISKEGLENSIIGLVRPGETNSIDLQSVILVNHTGEIIAAAPTNVVTPSREQLVTIPNWDGQIVWLANLVDLGTNLGPDLSPGVIVLPSEEANPLRRQIFTNLPPGTNLGPPPGFGPPVARGDFPPPSGRFSGPRRGGEGGFDGPRPESRFVKPPWMSEDDYDALSQKQGAHNFFVGMSTQPVHDADAADLWIRTIIVLLGTMGLAGYALAYQSLVKSSDLQVRLVRASEMNLHLKEMNLAAAGLAHETRNPLNIIRGLAQMISKQQDASVEVRNKTRDIIDETDRVTAQLNEFINYSRPREVRRVPTDLSAVVSEVARTLNYDIQEKAIQLQIVMEPLIIEADEQLLRQALFNLVLNAIQAVSAKGEIRVRASKRNNEEVFIEISDNGPGVPQVNRAEIFKPYFTTHAEGTGLGLSVVQQIVQAHGWDIECLPNDPAGALFRIAHVKLSRKD